MTTWNGTAANGSAVLIDAWIKPTVHHEGEVWWAESEALDGARLSASAFSLRELLDRWRELCMFSMSPLIHKGVPS